MKLKAFIIFVCLTLTTQFYAFGVIGYEAGSEIVSDYDYECAQALLHSLQIIDDNEKQLSKEEYVNRGQFAVLLSGILGMSSLEYSGQSEFIDLVPGDKVFSAVNYLTRIGIIQEPMSLYEANQHLTYQQAIYMVVNALGYGRVAEGMGGYPLGYISQAVFIGILDGLKIQYNNVAQRGGLVKILYNALLTETMQVTAIRPNDQNETAEPGPILLTHVFKAHIIKGVVTKTEITGLSDGSALGKNQIEIGGQIYKTERMNTEDLLGYRVRGFYKEEYGENKIIEIGYDTGMEEPLVVTSDQRIAISGREYSFIDNNRIRTATISIDSSIIYNGKYAAYDQSIMIPANGTVTLLRNGTTDGYNVVIIKEYTNLVVQHVNTVDNIIYGKYNAAPLELMHGGTHRSIRIKNVDGSEGQIQNLKEWNVLSYYISLDFEYVNITVSTNSIAGTVASIAVLDGYSYLSINSEEYKVSASYPNSGSNLISVGDNGSYYIDVLGNIAGFNRKSADSWNFGFLVKMADTNQVFTSREIKLLESSGKSNVLELANKVVVDGNNLDANKFDLDRQVIRYKLDTNGRINAIDTKEQGINEKAGNLYISNPQQNLRYYQPALTFGFKLSIADSTLIFSIPVDEADTDRYRVIMPTQLGTERNYDVLAYNLDEDAVIADVLVIIDNGDQTSVNDSIRNIAVVDRITTAFHEDDSILEKVVLGENGGVTTQYSISSDYLTSLGIKSGDIIRYRTDYRGLINHAEKIFDFGKSEMIPSNPYPTPELDGFANYRVLLGYVYSKGNDYIRVTRNGEMPESLMLGTEQHNSLENFLVRRFTVTVYDSTLNGGQIRVRGGNFNDIRDYVSSRNDATRVVVQTRGGDGKSIIVYK